MLIPSCTQRSIKSGVVITRSLLRGFSCLYLRLHVQTPQFDQLRQDLVDGEGVEVLQPLIRGVRHLIRMGVFRHNERNVLEHLQAEQVKTGTLLVAVVHAFFKRSQILVDIPTELDNAVSNLRYCQRIPLVFALQIAP